MIIFRCQICFLAELAKTFKQSFLCEMLDLKVSSLIVTHGNKREWRVRELKPHIDLSPKVIPLRLYLDMVPSSFAHTVTSRIVRTFSWKMKMRHRIGYFKALLGFSPEITWNGLPWNKSLCEQNISLHTLLVTCIHYLWFLNSCVLGLLYKSIKFIALSVKF